MLPKLISIVKIKLVPVLKIWSGKFWVFCDKSFGWFWLKSCLLMTNVDYWLRLICQLFTLNTKVVSFFKLKNKIFFKIRRFDCRLRLICVKILISLDSFIASIFCKQTLLFILRKIIKHWNSVLRSFDDDIIDFILNRPWSFFWL